MVARASVWKKHANESIKYDAPGPLLPADGFVFVLLPLSPDGISNS